MIHPRGPNTEVHSHRHAAKDITIWRKRLRNVSHAVLPSSTHRPNPLAIQDRLFVSIFSPGSVIALDRGSGEIQWRRRLEPYGGSEVLHADSILFAQTPHTLHALDPENGKEIWRFCPYGIDRETIYSAPTFSHGRVFIGDRRGYLHALDARTGGLLWSLLTSRAANNDVNGPPLVIGNTVLVATNAGRLVAADAKTGRVIWNQRTGGSSINEIARVPGGILVATYSALCWFAADTGALLARRSFPRRAIMTYATKADRAFAVLAPKKGVGRELVGLRGYEVLFRRREDSVWTLSRLAGGQILKTSFDGIAILSPVTGKASVDVRLGEECMAAQPAEYEDKLYILTSAGVLWALRWPPSTPQ